MKKIVSLIYILLSISATAQNMVPNPSFENMTATYSSVGIECAVDWRDNCYLFIPALNTPDLHTNGSTFLTSINAYDGIRYAGLDCSAANPEYIQVKLNTPMVAGTTYCVSFYTSLYNRFNTPPPFIGAYFSNSQLTANPYLTNLAADIQAPGPTDPTKWIQIAQTYTAAGGEQYMTIGCFQDNVPVMISYTYIDLVDVHPMNISVDLGADQTICPGENVMLDAGNDGTSYLWSNGDTTSSVTLTAPGTYWVQKFSGACPVSDTIELSNDNCITPPPPVDSVYEGSLYIPNSFTPNGDGVNDIFAAKGDHIKDFEMDIFDRWGERIFSSTDVKKGWDGTLRGSAVEAGVYVYTLKYTNGLRKLNRTGHVVLIR